MSSNEENNATGFTDENNRIGSNEENSSAENSIQSSQFSVGPARMKEVQKQHIRRPKRKSDTGESMKKRNQKRKLNQIAKVAGHFLFYAESETEKIELCNKLDRAKMMVDETIPSTSNYTILNHVLDHFLKTPAPQNNASASEVVPEFQQYLYREYDDDKDDELYMYTFSDSKHFSWHTTTLKEL